MSLFEGLECARGGGPRGGGGEEGLAIPLPRQVVVVL